MRTNKAFTLIELLVVIAIIALLLSILLPSLGKAKDHARAIVCSSHLKQIGVAANTYAESNDQQIPRSEVADTAIDWSVPEPWTCNWQICFSPYLAGGEGFRGYWGVGAYNCPSYPDKTQTMDYIINGWKHDSRYPLGDQSTERRGLMKLTSVRNAAACVYISEYAYFGYRVNASGMLESTGTKGPGHIRIITKEMIQTWNPDALYYEMRYMDAYQASHLPGIANPAVAAGGDGSSTRRIAYNRHKKNGTNNLFLDGHVEWLHADDQTPQRWAVRE
jgi:prepilin-type N-terminal cleavage/methylation domain-containing protein/prepilin-type processing-associated H-X9-DG protein